MMYRCQRGYVLVLTIAALAMLMLAGAYIGQHVSTALRLAAAEQQQATRERDVRDVSARLVYTLATVKRSSEGLGAGESVIRLDGRWYDVGNGAAVALQDARGLINLKTAPREWVVRLLGSYGVDAQKTQALADALQDYVDDDSLKRLQGAEADDYAHKGLLPPRNQPLVTAAELLRVYGWLDESILWQQDGILANTVVERGTGMNPNTATWRTLVAALGIPADVAKEMINQRRQTGVLNLAAYQGGGGAVDIFNTNSPVAFPSPTTVVMIGFPGSAKVWRFTMTIVPGEKAAPWRISPLQEQILELPVPKGGLAKLPDVSGATVDIDKEIPILPF